MFYTFALYAYALLLSLMLSITLTPLFKHFAIKWGILAHPHKERLHQTAIPLLGGVAIVLSFYLCIIINYCFLRFIPNINALLPEELIPYLYGALKSVPQFSIILICGLLIFFLGLMDDINALGPKRKFIFEIFVGIILYYNDIRITLFFGEGFISLCVTVFWVLAITNAFNLLDNIDGLSSGIAIIASFMLFLLCVQGGQILVSLLLVIFIGSLLGFLRYNYPPASVFMGDAGSLFTGYLMSVLIILSTFYSNGTLSLIPFVAPLLILAVPIYDTFSVICIRIKNKKSIFTGDKNHFSHRLLQLGMSQKEAVLFIYLIALCLGIAALTLTRTDLKSQFILLLQSGGLLTIIYLLERIKNQ